METIVAARGEDNFARNDLALLEISAGDHRIEVVRFRGVSGEVLVGDCDDCPGRRTRLGVRTR